MNTTREEALLKSVLDNPRSTATQKEIASAKLGLSELGGKESEPTVWDPKWEPGVEAAFGKKHDPDDDEQEHHLPPQASRLYYELLYAQVCGGSRTGAIDAVRLLLDVRPHIKSLKILGRVIRALTMYRRSYRKAIGESMVSEIADALGQPCVGETAHD